MTQATTPTLTQVAAALRGYRYSYHDEDRLQAGAAAALAAAGIAAEREVILGDAGRIDLLAGRVGVEVKIHGQPQAVGRQLRRYLDSGLLDGLVLLTSRWRHTPPNMGMDDEPRLLVASVTGTL